jgi:hypothetical protein
MRDRYLEVTYRKGRPFAAYLYLPRPEGAKSARTEAVGEGLVIDLAGDGSPIGLEITAPGHDRPRNAIKGVVLWHVHDVVSLRN